uniref:hypothetical protein n=1 Tax=Hassallia byssoidea TaxID=482630 RepID=UPI001F329DC2|nr:hypothetical protein [Hassalia byssoidea]
MLELTIQEELLKALSNSLEKEIAIIQLSQEERLVIQPLVQPELVSNEDEWIATRKHILTMQMRSKELTEASEALGEFKSVFKDFVEGKLSIKKLNNFFNNIDAFLAILEENKKTANSSK